MLVTATETYISTAGERRGRVCEREDGLWVFVTEHLTDETDECLPYWVNDCPPSGLYRSSEDATAALQSDLGEMQRLCVGRSPAFNTDRGPYPEP